MLMTYGAPTVFYYYCVGVRCLFDGTRAEAMTWKSKEMIRSNDATSFFWKTFQKLTTPS